MTDNTTKTFEDVPVTDWSSKKELNNNKELLDLFLYIMGDNKDNKCYFNPNDINSLIEAINNNAQQLLDLHINDCEHENYEHIRHLQMNILFGPNWESQYQNATINKATKQINKLADKLEHPKITAKQIADKLRNNASNDILNNTKQDNQNEEYEFVNHPSHYNLYPIEAIEMARRIWGDEAMKTAAEITAFFYRMRMGLKPENSVEQELNKEKFWLEQAEILRKKIEQNNN